MASKLEGIARDLFIKLGDSINQAATESSWRDASGRLLRRVRISTHEHYQKDEPWKDIFYMRFYFRDAEFSTLVGVGSLTRNQIELNMDLVPERFWTMLHDKFFFSVIAVREPLEEIKKDFVGQPAERS